MSEYISVRTQKVGFSPVVVPVLEGSLEIEQSVKNKCTMRFDTIMDSIDDFEIGQHIYADIKSHETGDTVLEYIFLGLITDIDISVLVIGGELKATISAIDYSVVYDNIIISETYENYLGTNIFVDIYNKYLIPEYPTWSYCKYSTTIIKKAVFNYISVSEAFDYLCNELGYFWNISTSGWLSFHQNNELYTSNINKENIYDVRISKTLENYRNRQYIKGGYDTTTLQVEQPTPQPDGVSTNFFVRYPFAKVPTIKINSGGGFVTVTSASVGIDGIDTGKWFYWNKGKNYISQDVAVLPTLTTQSVQVDYYGLVKILVQTDNTDSQSEMKEVQYYSSGIYSKIEEIASIETRDEAINYANGLLYQYRYMPEEIEIVTNCRRPVGHMVNVSYTGLISNQLYFIESRNISYNSVNNIIYKYKLLNNQSRGNWTDFFRKIQLKSNDLLINDDTQLIKLQHMSEDTRYSGLYNFITTSPLYVDDTTILSDLLTVGGTLITAEDLPDL